MIEVLNDSLREFLSSNILHLKYVHSLYDNRSICQIVDDSSDGFLGLALQIPQSQVKPISFISDHNVTTGLAVYDFT